MKVQEVTQDFIKEWLLYQPETGHFIARKNIGTMRRAGEIAGSLQNNGYWEIKMFGKRFWAHRLAWFYTYGRWPKDQIDHIDGNKINNALSNLREVNCAENQWNQRKANRDSKSGFLGITFSRGKWHTKIVVNSKRIDIGSFNTAEEAHEAYLQKKREVHTTCTI